MGSVPTSVIEASSYAMSSWMRNVLKMQPLGIQLEKARRDHSIRIWQCLGGTGQSVTGQVVALGKKGSHR
jgi:hypothetical protein